jgi:glycosyltransferase involved in cell wall biosynthesis
MIPPLTQLIRIAMNILFFATKIIYGGGEKVRNWLVKQLHNAGHSVYYVTEKTDSAYHDALIKVGLDGIVTVVEYPFYLKKTRPIKYCNAVKQIFKENNIDLLIIFGGSLVEQIIARRLGMKVLLSERFYNGFRPFLSRMLKHLQYRVADGYVFQTPEASRMYNRRASRVGCVIANPIIDQLPEPQFDNLRKEVVNIGRLCDQKDQATLIRAFYLFHKKHPEYKLIIYGSGEYKGRLLRLIDDLNLSDCSQIVGGVTDITQRINGASMFVLSSKAEGMPNALIEAMSMGVLSISTDCPAYGSRMLIENNVNAVLVPVGNETIMSEEMNRLVNDEALSNSIRHRAVAIRERLNAEKTANAWLEYINKIVG